MSESESFSQQTEDRSQGERQVPDSLAAYQARVAANGPVTPEQPPAYGEVQAPEADLPPTLKTPQERERYDSLSGSEKATYASALEKATVNDLNQAERNVYMAVHRPQPAESSPAEADPQHAPKTRGWKQALGTLAGGIGYIVGLVLGRRRPGRYRTYDH